MPILGRMTRREKKWALWTILAGVFLGFLLCTGVHVCMGARLDRPPYHWYSLIDLVWAGALVLLAIGLVAEYRMWGMAGVLLGVCVLRLVMGSLGVLLLPFEIAALVLVGTRASKRISRPRIVEKPAGQGPVVPDPFQGIAGQQGVDRVGTRPLARIGDQTLLDPVREDVLETRHLGFLFLADHDGQVAPSPELLLPVVGA